MLLLFKLSTYQPSLSALHQRPVLSVDCVVEPASVAQIVPRPIPPPQRGGNGATVHALSAVGIEICVHGAHPMLRNLYNTTLRYNMAA